MVISNRYKDNLDDFINSSDLELPDWLRRIDKRLFNVPRSIDNSTRLLKKSCLDKNVSDYQSAKWVPKTENSQIYYHHENALLSPISKKEYYEKDERDKKK